jgi:hypothetical protein
MSVHILMLDEKESILQRVEVRSAKCASSKVTDLYLGPRLNEVSTVGVDLGKWKCKKAVPLFAKKYPPIEFLTWDFAGQVYSEARHFDVL